MGTQHPSTLIISGFDPCGDAGLISDAKVLNSLGCKTLGIITCQTIQNDLRIEQCIPSDSNFIDQQISNIISTYHIDAIKIGVIPDSNLISTISEKIKLIREKNPQLPIVVDPILMSSSGYRFCDESALHTMLTQLIPLATMITPNLQEAQSLTGKLSPQEAAESLLYRGCHSVFISGVQKTDTQLTHHLYQSIATMQTIHCKRLKKEFHGSGCVFSSAVTSFLAHGFDYVDSSNKAVAFTYDYLHQRL